MPDLLSQFGVGAFIAVIAVIGTFLIPIAAIIGGLIYKHRKLQVEAALKHEMIERGMSADEIQQVLEASTSARGRRRHCGTSRAREMMDS
jgi:hypothetical protein